MPETDYDKLKALLTEFGVQISEPGNGEMEAKVIGCYQGDAKVDGRPGFFTEFAFDKDGKFLNMGAWE